MAKAATTAKAPTQPVSGSDEVAGLSPTISRRRLNRGSTRRITKAMVAFDTAMGAFIREMDLQFYMAEDDGVRLAECELVSDLRDVKEGVLERVNLMLHPPVDAPETAE